MQFTSYKSHSDSDLLETTKIWEAARATSAAPSFFDPIKICRFREEFGDGGTGANNPVRILWNQAQYCLNQGGLVERNLGCFVSIGTGIPSLEPFGDQLMKVAKTLQNIATETERTAKLFREEHAELAKQNRYFRFNVSRGLEDFTGGCHTNGCNHDRDQRVYGECGSGRTNAALREKCKGGAAWVHMSLVQING